VPAIPIGAITLYYETHGKGDTVVLLPDLGNDVTSLETVTGTLSQTYRCIVIDNRGVGRSSKPSSPYTTKLMAEDTIQVMDYLRIDKAHFFGASMGAAIAQEVAIARADKVRSLSLLGAWSHPDKYLCCLFELFRDVKRSVDPLTFDREVALWSFTRQYFDTNFDELERRQRAALDVPYPTPSTTFTRQAEACMNHNSHDRLGQVNCPVQLIVGARDIFTPRRFAEEMSEQLSNARIDVLDNAAHAAYWEQPAALSEAVGQFLAGVGD
jgi:pimeloyl-ACP methyl ester carboxylesterase